MRSFQEIGAAGRRDVRERGTLKIKIMLLNERDMRERGTLKLTKIRELNFIKRV
jgi:hypothetical protein